MRRACGGGHPLVMQVCEAGPGPRRGSISWTHRFPSPNADAVPRSALHRHHPAKGRRPDANRLRRRASRRHVGSPDWAPGLRRGGSGRMLPMIRTFAIAARPSSRIAACIVTSAASPPPPHRRGGTPDAARLAWGGSTFDVDEPGVRRRVGSRGGAEDAEPCRAEHTSSCHAKSLRTRRARHLCALRAAA